MDRNYSTHCNNVLFLFYWCRYSNGPHSNDIFIIPAKLPDNIPKVKWQFDERYINVFGIRIECRDEIDMFSADAFPCLQVSCMKYYKQRPNLSRSALKAFGKAECMLQVTDDKLAIHVAVRTQKETQHHGFAQLQLMWELVANQLAQRSIGTNVTVSYLSPNDLKKSEDVVQNVRYYSVDELNNAIKNTHRLGLLVNPVTNIPDTVDSVIGVVKCQGEFTISQVK